MIAYLDTHTVLWLHQGLVEEFSKHSQNLIDSHDLLISPAVLLEIQLLREIGRLVIGPNEIFADLSERIGLNLCEKPFPSIIKFALTQRWTRDPFDRLIVAQCRGADAPLITKDRSIRRHYKLATW